MDGARAESSQHCVQMVWIDSHRVTGDLYSAVFTRTLEMCEDVRKDMIATGRYSGADGTELTIHGFIVKSAASLY